MLCIDLPLFICQKAPIEVIREITRSWLDSGVLANGVGGSIGKLSIG
jgi:hypothetical protein